MTPFTELTSSDFVKYFAKKYFEAYNKEYKIIYARDCSIMLKIMRRFHEADVNLRNIFTFMDKMFIEYPKRRRFKQIDMNWLHGVVNLYLKDGGKLEEKSNKAKAPIQLDDEMKAWLKAEKEKWMK